MSGHAQENEEAEDASGEDNKNVEVKYSNEQKIVAAVWMHERTFNSQTIEDIKNNFKIRFKMKPPKLNVLSMWENELFTKGEIKGDENKDNFNIDDLSDVGSTEEDISD